MLIIKHLQVATARQQIKSELDQVLSQLQINVYSSIKKLHLKICVY